MILEKGDTVPEIIDRRRTERGEVQLQKRGERVYEIIYNGIFLIASYNDRSEKILARTALERLIPTMRGYEVLIGGLGMGFTLQEVLSSPQVSRAVVVEIEKVIMEWNRSHLSELNDEALRDPRTVLIHCDLFDYLWETSDRFDAVLVDVDNGPNWLALEKNRRLYGKETLQRIKKILTPDGVLATWSAQKDEGYLMRLREVLGRAEEIIVEEAFPQKGASLVYIGTARS